MKRIYLDTYHKLIEANKFIEKNVNKAFQNLEVTYSQYVILKKLIEIYPDPCKASYLSKNLYANVPDITRILDRLESKQLITKERSTISRREIKIDITAQGTALVKQMQPIEEEALQFLTKLTEEESEQLIDLLTILTEE